MDKSNHKDGQESCEIRLIHPESIEAVKKKIPNGETIRDLSEIYKALADYTRLKIILSLTVRELCVCDLASLLDVSESATSHHLRRLRDLKLVRYRKEGKVVYYSIDDEHVSSITQVGLSHLAELNSP